MLNLDWAGNSTGNFDLDYTHIISCLIKQIFYIKWNGAVMRAGEIKLNPEWTFAL